jgi:GMP synthase PP-ATPase subunit
MKLQSLNVKKLRKRSIAAIRDLLKMYNINYSIMDDKDRLIDKLSEIQIFSRKIKIYQRYEMTI